MANMNMIIHDMEGQIEIGDTFKNPKFRKGNRLQTFDRVDRQSDVESGLVQGKRLRRRRARPLSQRRRLSRQQGRLGLGAAHPREHE